MAAASMIEIAAVATGGAIGSLLRYGISLLSVFDGGKHFATMTANITGCLLIGIAWVLLRQLGASRAWEMLLITGLLGGYTTFSTFSRESFALIHNGMAWQALGYIAISLIGGLAACAIGYYTTERIIRLM